MKTIPNELAKNFADINGRKKIIEEYGNSEQAFLESMKMMKRLNCMLQKLELF